MPKAGSGRVEPGTGKVYYTTSDGTDSQTQSTFVGDESASASGSSGVQSVSGRILGSGATIYAGTNGTRDIVLEFKSFVAGNGVKLTETASEIKIDYDTSVRDLSFFNLQEAPSQIIPGAFLVGTVGGDLDFTPAPTAPDTVLVATGSGFEWRPMPSNMQYRGTVTSVALTGSADITVTGNTITQSGSFGLALANTGVAVGTYRAATISVDAKGRVIFAEENEIGEINTASNLGESVGLFKAKVGSDLQFKSLKGAGVIDVLSGPDEVTLRVNAVTAVNLSSDGSLDVRGGPITSSGTIAISLSNTGVTPGTYTSVEVDAQGRVVFGSNHASDALHYSVSSAGAGESLIANGSGQDFAFKSLKGTSGVTVSATASEIILSANAVTRVAATGSNGVTVSGGPVTSVGSFDIGLTETGVAAGTYDYAQVTIDAFGRITAANSAPAPETITAENLGGGQVALFKGKDGSELQFRTLRAGTNVTILPDGDSYIISAAGGEGGSGTASPIAASNSTVLVPTVSEFKFGNGITFSANGGVVSLDVIPPAPPQTYPLTVLDEGSALTSVASALNFTGDGVSATRVGNAVTVSIPGYDDEALAANVAALQGEVAPLTANVGLLVDDVAALRAEVDGIETGTGLASDGSYAANTDTHYLANAFSLRDADERLDAALKSLSDTVAAIPGSNPGSGTGTVTSVALTGSEFDITGSPITSSGTISIALKNSGAAAGSYSNPNVTIDAKGRVTAISSGPAPTSGASLAVLDEGTAITNAATSINFAGAGITATQTGNAVTVTVPTFDASGLQAEIDAIETGAGLAANGAYTANGTANYIAAATSLANADNRLDTALKALSDVVATKGTGNGTVTSVAISGTEFVITGSPVTTNGTIGLALANTGISAGQYQNPVLTVDAKGRVTAIANGAAGSGSAIQVFDEGSSLTTAATSFNFVGTGITATQTGGAVTVTVPSFDPASLQNEIDVIETGAGLAANGAYVANATANYLSAATSLTDADNRLDTALKSLSNVVATKGTGNGNGTVTSVSLSGTSDFVVGGSPVTSTGTLTIALSNTGVSAGTFNTLTVDVHGRVTAASNTAYLTQNQTITLSGDITGSGTSAITATLANTGVTPGSYSLASVTVDAKGRITAVSNGSAGAGSSLAVLDEGASITSAATSLNFAGAGVTATNSGGAVTVTIPTTDLSGLQTEIDAIETGAGLNANGTYTANATGNYVSGANSLKDADNKLDAAIKVLADSKLNANATAVAATKLATPRTFAYTGDATGTSAGFDGTANVSTALTLANTGVAAGSYTNANITVDAKGRITAVASGAAGGGGSSTPIPVKDEGSQVTAGVASLNFTGAGVTASDDGAGNVTVNVPGASGGTGSFPWSFYEVRVNYDATGNVLSTAGSLPDGWVYTKTANGDFNLQHNLGRLPQLVMLLVESSAVGSGLYTQKYPTGAPTSAFSARHSTSTLFFFNHVAAQASGLNNGHFFIRVMI